MSWPGMGEARANALLDRYTYREIVGGDKALWMSAEGVGKGLANIWWDFVNRDFRAEGVRDETT